MRGMRLDCPDDTPPAMYELMMQCWQLLPENRPSAKTIDQSIRQVVNSRRVTRTLYLRKEAGEDDDDDDGIRL